MPLKNDKKQFSNISDAYSIMNQGTCVWRCHKNVSDVWAQPRANTLHELWPWVYFRQIMKSMMMMNSFIKCWALIDNLNLWIGINTKIALNGFEPFCWCSPACRGCGRCSPSWAGWRPPARGCARPGPPTSPARPPAGSAQPPVSLPSPQVTAIKSRLNLKPTNSLS